MSNYFLRIDCYSFTELLALLMIEVSDFEYYDQISCVLIKNNPIQTISLFDSLPIKQQCGIVFALGTIQPNEFDYSSFLLSLLSDDYHQDVITQAILALKYLPSCYFDNIEPFLTSDFSNIKGSAISYFSQKQGLLFKEKLIHYLQDNSAHIRHIALNALDDLSIEHHDNQELNQQVIKLAHIYQHDEDKRVRQCADYILKRFAEDDDLLS